MLSSQDVEQKVLKREEVRKAIQMSQKFEMIEVHPLYASGRLAARSDESLLEFLRVEEVKDLVCRLSNKAKVEYDDIVFASRAFTVQPGSLEEVPA